MESQERQTAEKLRGGVVRVLSGEAVLMTDGRAKRKMRMRMSSDSVGTVICMTLKKILSLRLNKNHDKLNSQESATGNVEIPSQKSLSSRGSQNFSPPSRNDP